VDFDATSFEMNIHIIPPENPKIGRIPALSVIAAIKKIDGNGRGWEVIQIYPSGISPIP